jgi:hypothetical protein
MSLSGFTVCCSTSGIQASNSGQSIRSSPTPARCSGGPSQTAHGRTTRCTDFQLWRIADAGRAAFVRVDLEADLGADRQHQDLACLVTFGWPMKVYSPAVAGVPQKIREIYTRPVADTVERRAVS